MVSIIIPIYNAQVYLDDCLNSISLQTYKDFEVLCIDDGSTDNSRNICEKFVEKDERFHLYCQQNSGVSAARNVGIEVSRGEWVVFVDSDDVLSSEYLAHLMCLSVDGSFPICGYTQNMKELGNGDNTIARYDAKEYIRRIVNESIKHPNIWMMLFKNSIIRDNNLRFVIGCVRNEDTEFFTHYLLYEKTVLVSNYIAYYYRPNPESVMRRPINVKSLTSIEASRRMNAFLVENGVINDESVLLSNGVLSYAYLISKSRNKELYSYLHENYDVGAAMKKMLVFPRLSKRMLALTYLLLGKSLFFKLIGFSRI